MKKYVLGCLASAAILFVTEASAGTVMVDPVTGLAYEFVSAPGISWAQASNMASSLTYNGQTGYLATITSQEQLNFIENNVSPGGISSGTTATANIFVGGVRVAGTTATWEWATGPLAGTIFWNNGPVAGEFAPWDPYYALGSVSDAAHPDSPGASALYINSWFRPYFTAAYPYAVSGGIYAGGNSGFIVEFGAVASTPNPNPGAGLVSFAFLLLMRFARWRKREGKTA